ncbi:hypothetical protein [Solimicrobium silvestre]|uniref:Uncharacterized protein n=1 Tax=Solimicrobium silvestre TaxID=2099400 RepID=A0A2S9GVL1_9BURK|nr:hypothetical protein [Solimicrobium silvestre]PRC91738.1 hypothetical protein S2091_3493 [Solimicrobium silvestre]
MTQQTDNQHKNPGKTFPSPLPDAKKQKQKEEQNEVVGRHKNDGQKDHKGAR